MINYSKEECIESFNNLLADYPDKIITRDFFRKNGCIPEGSWLCHYGTFAEFRRAAGQAPTRTDTKFLNSIAMVNSADDLREHNSEKFSWSDQYLKPSGKRIQTFLVGSDFHDIMCDPFYRRMFVEAAKAYSPDQVVFNGDLFDLIEFSRYKHRPAEGDSMKKIHWVRDLNRDLRNIVPDAEFHLVEGNHEYRLVKFLTERAPMLLDILGFQGLGVKEVLGLHEFDVNYHSRADFATFTDSDIANELKRNYYRFQDHVLFHHFPVGKTFGMPGVSGHHHKFKAWDEFNLTYGPYTWYQLGGGVRRSVDYLDTMGEKWTNGFMVIHVDTQNKKNTVFEYIDTTNEFAVICGCMFQRKEEEKVFLT